MRRRMVDYLGNRFGKLTVLQLIPKIDRHARFLCRCDCGAETTVRYANLLNGCTTSCGCVRRQACRERERKKGHPTHGIVLSYYKRNAKLRNLVWNISREEFDRLISGFCHYCGVPPRDRRLAEKELKFNGIDRLDNKRGYEIDNLVSCCDTCNKAKLAMSVDEFRNWIVRVAKHFGVL